MSQDSLFFSIDQLVKILNGRIIQKQDSFIYGVSTDSRQIQKGDLFIPLVGENFDGHNFIEQVANSGAGCALTSRDIKINSKISLIHVKDTLKALQDLAAFYRKNNPFKIVGITGSNGKTTTKFFAEAILSTKFKTFASQKSFNNHIGVPLTLLSLKPSTEVGIVEIGMNHAGEISALTQLADPDVSLVTTVGRAHLMDFEGLDGIAKEKSDIYKCSKEKSARVFNLDNPYTQKMSQDFKSKQKNITFSLQSPTADVHFKIQEMTLEALKIKGHILGKTGECTIPVFGAQNATNLMAAAGIAVALGLTPEEIWKALPKCQTVWGRNMMVRLKSGAELIFDGYNANPDSTKALLENISQVQLAGKKIVILGDMLEMGGFSEELHEELGRLAGQNNFDAVWFLGQFSESFRKGIESTGFSKNLFISNGYEESLAAKVASMVHNSDVVVMKGSRGAKLEKLVPHFGPLNWENLK